MIRSFRARFFLLVWPLVVLALVLLGWLLGRWSVVEIGRISEESRLERLADRITEQLADSLAVIPATDVDAMRALLVRMSERDSLARGAVIASADRGLMVTILDGLTAEDVELGPSSMMQVNYTRSTVNSRTIIKVAGAARVIDPPDSDDPRLLMVLPLTQMASGRAIVAPDPGSLMIRRIAMALVIGSVIAALATFILSGQLTGRVEKLAAGVRALGGGDLAARVPVEGKDEIAALAESFNKMAAGLELSEAQRRRMVSDVAHELRTPLTNLVAMVESVRDGLRPADPALLDALAEEAGLLNRLVDDLRDLALSDAGELTLELATIDALVVARRAVESFAGARGVRIVHDGLTSVPVLADERRLGQVLRNLIGNAVTHSPEGDVVTVAVTETGNRKLVTISVRDHGPGIAPEDLPRIWERFYRIDPSRSRATGGMGLGLPVSKRLVEMMGGTIEVESEVGEETTFSVILEKVRSEK